MDQQNNQVAIQPIDHQNDVDTRQLELCFLSNYQTRLANCLTSFLVSWWIFSTILFFFIIDKKQFDFTILWLSYCTLIMMILSIRFWWIWWWSATDSMFWIGAKIRISSALHGLTLAFGVISTIMIKVSNIKDSLFIDIAFIIPCLTTAVIMNIINIIRLLRLWYVWHKVRKATEVQRRFDESIFQSVFRNREGYREVRQEIEAAGIEGVELDEVQRMEWRHARDLLRQFGNRPQNINILRLLLNIDGDQNAEDTDENRVILYSRIKCLRFSKTKFSDVDWCSICCNDFNDEEIVKILPKWAHIFHEDCIEKWILKAKRNNICCPVWRVNIKEELDAEEVKTNDEENPIQNEESIKSESGVQSNSHRELIDQNLSQSNEEEKYNIENIA